MKLFTAICLMIILISCAGPGPYGHEPYGPVPGSYGPGPYGPVPGSYGPGPYGPGPYGPGPYGPEPYGPEPYGSAVYPAMSGPQLPVSYQRKCYDCRSWRQDANPN
jgi:UPF0755 protein